MRSSDAHCSQCKDIRERADRGAGLGTDVRPRQGPASTLSSHWAPVFPRRGADLISYVALTARITPSHGMNASSGAKAFSWVWPPAPGAAVPANPAAAVLGPAYSVKSGRGLHPTRQHRHDDACGATRPRADYAGDLQLRAGVGRRRHPGGRCLRAEASSRGAAAREGRQGAPLPCHHTLEGYLRAYLAGCGLTGDP